MSNLPYSIKNPAPPDNDGNNQDSYGLPTKSGYPYAPSEPPTWDPLPSAPDPNSHSYQQEPNMPYGITPHPGRIVLAPHPNHIQNQPGYPSADPFQVGYSTTELNISYPYTGPPGSYRNQPIADNQSDIAFKGDYECPRKRSSLDEGIVQTMSSEGFPKYNPGTLPKPSIADSDSSDTCMKTN